MPWSIWIELNYKFSAWPRYGARFENVLTGENLNSREISEAERIEWRPLPAGFEGPEY
jgi:hypothetical protein